MAAEPPFRGREHHGEHGTCGNQDHARERNDRFADGKRNVRRKHSVGIHCFGREQADELLQEPADGAGGKEQRRGSAKYADNHRNERRFADCGQQRLLAIV